MTTAVADPLKRARARRAAQVKAARARSEDFIEYALRDEQTGARIRNAWFHKEWQQHWREHALSLLIAPIEHGKTQQVAGKVLHLLGEDTTRRIALVSNTADQAQKLLRQVRTNIDRNVAVQEVFPKLVPSENEEDPWHTSMITVQRPTVAKDPSVQACGVFGPIVGSRLDVIVLDDVLDFENTRTEEQRKKLVEWFDTTLFTRLAPGGQIIVIGTPWHLEDLLHVLEARPDFKSRRYCAVHNPDEDESKWRPIWPEQWPLDRLLLRKRNTEETVFARKYLCRVRRDETSRFKQLWIDRAMVLGRGRTLLAEAPKTPAGKPLQCFTGVDLGPGEQEDNALTVLFTIALLPNAAQAPGRIDGRRLVVDVQSGHWKAPEIIDRLFLAWTYFGSWIMVESNGAQRLLTQMCHGRVPVASFNTTGTNKWDEEWGVESLAIEFRNQEWVVPSGASGTAVHPEVKAWLSEMLNYQPSAHTGDRLMASWLAREALRRFSGGGQQRMDTLHR